MQKRVRLIIVIVITVGMCSGSCLLIRAYGAYSFQAKVHELTTPLDPAIAQDLCLKLKLPDIDKRCQPDAVVYAPDFYKDIGNPFDYEETTYQEVQALFGEYQYDCKPREVTADGYSFFQCWYDFHGDQMFPVVFRFAGEDDILDQIIPVLFDSP